MKEQVIHPFPKIFNQESRILILGSFPSPKSREQGFYYGHPKNRFWKVLAVVLEEDIPKTREEKERLILKNHLALWDVIKSCEIKGASDNSITNVVVNPLTEITNNSKVQYIFTVVKTADKLYRKYCQEQIKIPSICLPSTSPANCAVSFKKLVENYQKVSELLHKNEKK